MDAHRAELDGKSRTLVFGKVGYRASSKLMLAPAKVAEAIAALKALGRKELVKTTETLDREALKRSRPRCWKASGHISARGMSSTTTSAANSRKCSKEGGAAMGALDIDKGQVKNIYAIAAKLGMVDRSSHEGTLHELVQGLTGKTSVKDLTHSEALEVLTELRRRSTPATPKKKNGRGNMTKHRAASARRSRKKSVVPHVPT